MAVACAGPARSPTPAVGKKAAPFQSLSAERWRHRVLLSGRNFGCAVPSERLAANCKGGSNTSPWMQLRPRRCGKGRGIRGEFESARVLRTAARGSGASAECGARGATALSKPKGTGRSESRSAASDLEISDILGAPLRVAPMQPRESSIVAPRVLGVVGERIERFARSDAGVLDSRRTWRPLSLYEYMQGRVGRRWVHLCAN